MLTALFVAVVLLLLASPILVVTLGAASGLEERRRIRRISNSYDKMMSEIMRCTSK